MELIISSLRNRYLEVVGEKENGRARGRQGHRMGEGLLVAPPLTLSPTTSKRLLRRLYHIMHMNLLKQKQGPCTLELKIN